MSKSKIITAKSVLKEIDKLYEIFRYQRSFCPYIDPKNEGRSISIPFNLTGGKKFMVIFSEPLTKNFIIFNNQVGNLTNQNFLIRLYGLLEYYKVVGAPPNNIDPLLNGAEELDILRRLRTFFSHRAAPYNEDNKNEQKLYSRIEAHFKLSKPLPNDFIISIDTVIVPIVVKIKKYVSEKLK